MIGTRTRSRRKPPLLLFSDSETNADQLYFSGFCVPDPFISLRVRGRKIGVFSALEYGRAQKESALDQVLSLEAWQQRAKHVAGTGQGRVADVIAALARHFAERTFAVAADFPLALADQLRRRRLVIEPVEGGLFPEREIKSEAEATAIVAGNRCSAVGLAAAEALLRKSAIRGRRLFVEGRVLTSERVRQAIEMACLRSGGVSARTIVAGGDQACDPHCVGSGPLRPRELIIVDIFPRILATGYHGDMTRTFLKGEASDAQVALVEAVRAVQRKTIALMKPRADGKKVHKQVQALFAQRGFETKVDDSGATGFFHGTGHGLGLAVHEAPYVGRSGTRLREGTVVTVEPGLYYPGLGGCRVEDVVQVRPGKPRMLSKYPYTWRFE